MVAVLALTGCAPAAIGSTAISGLPLAATRQPSSSSAATVSPTSNAPEEAIGKPSPTPSQPKPAAVASGFDKNRLSITNSASVWVIANKLRALQPTSFAPSDLVQVPVPHQNLPVLRQAAADALVALFSAAKSEGAGGLQLQSAFRSYALQVRVYSDYVARLGVEIADAQSARPGFSEHQTGLAADISAFPANCTLAACFATTPQGRWLATNSWRFGYLLRYPSEKTAITGYIHEPWHFRYVGVELASEMHATGVATLEEFFGLPAAPNYGQ
ncbi:MAG: D-alanyl-D-alanine carboxypeptidase family protein [Microbacteriaceae bacterium]|nr:D-alanyl-D-alanine carboxypeptidase family protein [Microbacteriaceae bacterium]